MNLQNQKNPLKIGFIGAGANTKLSHIPGFQKQQNVETIGVVNRTKESSQAVATEFNIPKTYNNWQELIDDTEIDAVCIGTWPDTHQLLVEKSLEAGKHVLTESRMAMNAAQAYSMLQTSQRYPHLISQIVPASPTLYGDIFLKKLLSENYIGDILSVDVNVYRGLLDSSGPFMWRHNQEFSGYNIMLMGAWYECLLRWLPPAKSVYSITRIVNPVRQDKNNETQVCKIPDHLEILCELGESIICHLAFSESTVFAPLNQIWLYGTEGTLQITIDIKNDTMVLKGAKKGDSELKIIEIPKSFQYCWRPEEEFIGAIRGTENVKYTTFEDGVKYMEFTEAVHLSSSKRKPISLPFK